VDQVQQVATDARRITKLAEKRGKLSIALGGLREVSRNLELIGRLSGELLSGGANVAVGIASLSAADQAILAEAHRRQAMTAEEREKYNAELLAEMARIEKEIARYANKPTKRLHAGCGNPIAVQP
jgi:glucuronate isomerase